MNMYINDNLCLYQLKRDINKCDRIFRPWDNQTTNKHLKERDAQDSTVSTTTQEDEYKLGGKGVNVEDNNISKNKCKSTTESDPVPLVTSSGSPRDIATVENQSSHDDCISSKLNSYQNQALNGYRNKQIPSDPLPQTPSLYAMSCENVLRTPEMLIQGNQFSMDYLQDPSSLFSTDLMQANLAHQLGLPPNDPLLMESLAQGYALEEYARVLNQEQQAKLLAAKKQRPKKYRCPHCDVGFSNNGQLKGHIRIHTGERPFKCDEKDCGKTFTRNEELTRHKRIHSGLRPFPCSHCGKRFGRKDHLKKHSRTHFQPRGLYAVPVVLPFEAWASGHAKGYPFFPVMY